LKDDDEDDDEKKKKDKMDKNDLMEERIQRSRNFIQKLRKK